MISHFGQRMKRILPFQRVKSSKLGPFEVSAFSRGEAFAAGAFLLAITILRFWYPFVLPENNDEPQHLHVVWAWASGIFPYRDVFDNHAPLFQLLCAPLFKFLGERADIIIPMRFAMNGFYLLSLWSIYEIGKTLSSKRVGMWAMIFAGLEPRFFLTSAEFRTDDLWIALWLLTLAILAGKDRSPRRLFCAGLLLGATFSVSMKTVVLAISLLAAAGAVGLMGWRCWKSATTPSLKCVACLFGGLVVIPVAFLLFFSYQGALTSAYYCIFEHNIVPGLRRWHNLRSHVFIFALVLPVLLGLSFAVFRLPRPNERVRFWRTTLFLLPLLYMALLWGFWPDISLQDYLPFWPLVMLSAAAFLFLSMEQTTSHARLRWIAPTIFGVVELFTLIKTTGQSGKGLRREIALYRDTLLLTHPGEYVMDNKAGMIFRPPILLCDGNRHSRTNEARVDSR